MCRLVDTQRMEQIVELFIGILIAAGVFAATFFAAAQVFRQTGALRWAQLGSALATLVAMGLLSFGFWGASQVAGAALFAAAIVALALEHRWNRVLPVFHMCFGVALALGLPFGG